MRKLILMVVMVAMMFGAAFAIDFTGWKFALKQIHRYGDDVLTVVEIITLGGARYGREISWTYAEVKDLTLTQFKDKVKAQVRYIIEQDYEDYLLKQKVTSMINVEVAVE